MSTALFGILFVLGWSGVLDRLTGRSIIHTSLWHFAAATVGKEYCWEHGTYQKGEICDHSLSQSSFYGAAATSSSYARPCALKVHDPKPTHESQQHEAPMDAAMPDPPPYLKLCQPSHDALPTPINRRDETRLRNSGGWQNDSS